MIRTAARCVGLLALAAVNYAQVLHAPVLAHAIPQATLMTASDGSAFLPYGQGIAAYLASKGIDIAVKKSAGSNENLSAVDASATTIGTVLIGSAYDALNGTGWAAGHKQENLRALFPMYTRPRFRSRALRKCAIKSLADLDGKKVGVGPAKGAAEVFFRAAAEIAQIRPIIVNGDPALLTTLVAAGEIDALWQGAVVPIASLTEVASLSDAVIFGLSNAEVAPMPKTFPQLSATTVPPATYKGQTAEIRSVSAWNFVVANKDLANETAYAITKAVLSAADPRSEIYPTAAGTLAGNAAYNRIMPFHPGAMRFYAEAGLKLPRREA